MGLKNVIFGNLLLALSCFICGKLVGLLSLPPVTATPLWLPAGLAVSAVLIWGYRLLPGIFLGHLFIGLNLYGWTELSAINAAILAGAQSMLLAVSARYLVQRFSDWPSSLVREKQIFSFFLLTALVATILPSVLVAASQTLLDKSLLNHSISSIFIWWLGTVMGVIIVTPIMLSLFAKPRSLWQPRIITVALPMLLMFGLLLLMLTVARDRDNALNQTRFDASTGLVNALIENELNYHQTLLHSMQAYFHNSVEVTETEFQHFLDDFNDYHHDTDTVAWLQYVAPGKQKAFEQETGLRIQHYSDTTKQFEAKTTEREALVIRYLEHYRTEQNDYYPDLLGVNLCFSETQNLCQRQQNEQADLFAITRLITTANNESDHIVHLLPVTDDSGSISGYVMQVVDYKNLFRHLYQSEASASVEFVVTSLGDDSLLFESKPGLLLSDTSLYPNVKASRVIDHADIQWRIDYLPSTLFLSAYSSWAFYWTVFVALLLFSLASIWLMTLTGRYNQVENEVAEKTRELKLRSDLLAESEKKYRRLVENIQDEYFLYSHDSQGVFRYISPSVELILGYTQDEFLRHYTTYLPDTEINQNVPFFTEQTLAGQKSNYEVEIFDKSGVIHTLAVTEVPSYNENRDIIGVEGIARDITEFKMSQQKLEKLSLAVEHSPNAIVVMNKEGYVEYVNPKFTAITGYTNDETVGRWPDMINTGINMPGIYDEIWQTVRQGKDWRGELQYRKKNGDLYWAQELIAPMLDAEGNATHFVATQIDITEARRLSEERSYQATHDKLTGLINRHEFDVRLERVIHAAKHNLTEHALCFLDLDQFKLVNDTCGHSAGDELLRQIGGLLQTNVRSRDTIARLGGDEFAILMEHCSIDRAFKACEQILQLLRDFRFHCQEYMFTAGGSIGLAIIDQHTTDSNEALRNVDTACYSAKDAGRNRVEVHREDSLRLQQRRGEIHWSTEISEALDDDRFLLYTQPIKPLMNPERGMSYEVLVRMLRKDGQISPPGAFLPAAERYNSISRIDRWVVSHTFAWLNTHASKLNHIATISINLSGLSMGDESMLRFIIDELELANIPAEKVKFEITETAAIANLRAATIFIETLSKIGIRFALDDFGSGLSSFAYLKKLHVDSLKIDGMFVKDMVTDPIDYEMVKSINEIGHVMGLETIAEFVENEEILEKLREIGVDFVQGYAIGRPSPIDDILRVKK